MKLALGSGTLAAMVPPSIVRAVEIPLNRRTGTIADVEHVVILTQENRSFDHYFGTLRGVRGFADPRAVRLRSGRPVWYQPSDAGDILPLVRKVDVVLSRINLGAPLRRPKVAEPIGGDEAAASIPSS